MGFKTVTPEKIQQHVDFLRLSDKDPVKKLLTSNRIFWLLVNNFLTRSLSENRMRWACVCYFSGVAVSNLMQI